MKLIPAGEPRRTRSKGGRNPSRETASNREAEQRFVELYDRTSESLLRYVQRLVGDPDVAGDLAQDAYLRWLRSEVPKMNDRESRAYLFKIATRLVYDRTRRLDRESRWRILRPPEERAAPPIDAPGISRDLARVLGALSQRERSLLWLAYVEEYTHVEIADILGVKSASVKVLLSRARKKIAQRLREQDLIPKEVT